MKLTIQQHNALWLAALLILFAALLTLSTANDAPDSDDWYRPARVLEAGP